MAVVFLDANVLFSAAYRPDTSLLRVWENPALELMSSEYAVQEARRNLSTSDQRERLEEFISCLRLVASIPEVNLPASVNLPDKDRPILLAAIHGSASHLLTGDATHFGHLYGSSIGGVQILPPSEFLRAVG